MEQNQSLDLAQAQKKFELACHEAGKLQLIDNYGSAFSASTVVLTLREALTDEIMSKVFMPLMNTTIGFRTDKDPKRPRWNSKTNKTETPVPYTIEIVRDCIIDAVALGLQPTGNQFNIISERMYPTKEGYTHVLRKLVSDASYTIGFPIKEEQSAGGTYVVIPACVDYTWRGEKKQLKINAYLRKDNGSTVDNLRGKAERRLKKQLFENLTGMDMGDADSENITEDAQAEVIETHVAQNANQQPIGFDGAKKAQPMGSQQEIPDFMK